MYNSPSELAKHLKLTVTHLERETVLKGFDSKTLAEAFCTVYSRVGYVFGKPYRDDVLRTWCVRQRA